jgi:hypothetical protein
VSLEFLGNRGAGAPERPRGHPEARPLPQPMCRLPQLRTRRWPAVWELTRFRSRSAQGPYGRCRMHSTTFAREYVLLGGGECWRTMGVGSTMGYPTPSAYCHGAAMAPWQCHGGISPSWPGWHFKGWGEGWACVPGYHFTCPATFPDSLPDLILNMMSRRCVLSPEFPGLERDRSCNARTCKNATCCVA